MSIEELKQIEQAGLADVKKIADESTMYLRSNTMAPPTLLYGYVEIIINKLEEYRQVADVLAQQGLTDLKTLLNSSLSDSNNAKSIYKQMMSDQGAALDKLNQMKLDTINDIGDTARQISQNQQNASDAIFNKYIHQ